MRSGRNVARTEVRGGGRKKCGKLMKVEQKRIGRTGEG